MKTKSLNILAVILIITTIVCVQTKHINYCDNNASGFIDNPDTNCEYVFIYCNGEESFYCTETSCLAEYDCAAVTTVATVTAGRHISYCDDQAVGYINNPDTTCSYIFIYCDGENSYYCTETACLAEYDCASATISTTPSTTNTATTAATPSNATPSNKHIKYCDGQDVGFIENPDVNCAYVFIYCNGDSSFYCNALTCAADFDCPETATVTTPSTTTVTSPITTGSTAATTVNAKTLCTPGKNFYFAYPTNCNYYYQCIDGYLMVQNCPLGYAFSDEIKKCTTTKNAHCTVLEED